jgi:surface antigen
MDKSIAAMNTNNLEIVGMQELQSPQYDLFKKKAGNKYDMTKKGSNHLTENAIAWDKSKYTLEDSGIMPNLKYFFGSKLADPWVKLKATASGQEFFVLNTHDPADANGCECSSERYHDALEHSTFIARLKGMGLPILFTGDFNSGYIKNPMGHNGSAYQDKNDNLTYCILTRDGLVNDSYDLYKKRSVKCPNPLEKGDTKGAANGIDHIYVSPGITVSNFFRIPVGYTSNGSDHPTAVADVALPGSGGSSDSSTGAATPGAGFVGNDGFGGGSCVAYVEYILSHHSSRYKSGALGDGKDVANSLGSKYGYVVNHTPAIHATVSFPASMADPTYGHVALVGKINADGSIVVEESNWTNPNRYGTHTVSASQVKKLTYAHTEVGWH